MGTCLSCLSLCGRTGKYKPRQMEEEDRARNSETHHNVYRKANNAQSSEGTFGSKTVAQSGPFTVRIYGEVHSVHDKPRPLQQITPEEVKDLMKDLVYFEGMDSPNEYKEMKLTGDQKAEIKMYFSRLTQNELSFCYLYFPPHLPPGPDGINAKHLELYLEKEESDGIYAVIEYLRQKQFQKLIRVLYRLSNSLNLGVDDAATKSIARGIFHQWKEGFIWKNTKANRAKACFEAILKVVPHFRFAQPYGSILPWILFQVLHPTEENSGFLRTDNEIFVESGSDRRQGTFPAAVTIVESQRKSILIENEEKINQCVYKYKGYLERHIISSLYNFSEVDESTMAGSIPPEYAKGIHGIGLCYYTIYKHFTGDSLRAVLDSKAPSGSSKEDVLLVQEHVGNTVKCHQLAGQHDGNLQPDEEGGITRHVDEKPAGQHDGNLQPDEEGEITRHVDGKPAGQHDGNLVGQPDEEGEITRQVDGKPAGQHDGNLQPDEEGKITRHVDGKPAGQHDGNLQPDEEGEITSHVDGKPAGQHDGNLQPEEEGEITHHVDGKPAGQHDGNLQLDEEGEVTHQVDGNLVRDQNKEGETMHYVDGNLAGEPNEEGEIMHFNESMIEGDAHNDDQAGSERELGVPRQEEFFEIKERAEKQKRWKRRFDGTKSTEPEQEENAS